MNRRTFLLSALTSAAALFLIRIKGGVTARAEDDPLPGQFPMSVPYTIAPDPPKKYTFFPRVSK